MSLKDLENLRKQYKQGESSTRSVACDKYETVRKLNPYHRADRMLMEKHGIKEIRTPTIEVHDEVKRYKDVFFEEHVMPRLRLAEIDEYLAWLSGYLANGGIQGEERFVSSFNDEHAVRFRSRAIYVAMKDFFLPIQDYSLRIIVPSGIKHLLDEREDPYPAVLLLMDDHKVIDTSTRHRENQYFPTLYGPNPHTSPTLFAEQTSVTS